MLSGTLAFLIAQAVPQSSRFEWVAPLGLPPVKIHADLAKHGIAQSTATRQGLQARILWVDATANLGRYNSEEKVSEICAKAKEVGFNTIAFDVKPIVGYTVYPSKLTEQITRWRNETLEPGYDPLKHFVTYAHKNDLQLLVAMNAFSEGHSYSKRDSNQDPNPFFKPGWGYDHPELQTVRYVAKPTFRGLEVFPSMNPAKWDTPCAVFSRVPSAEDIEAYVFVDNKDIVVGVSATKPEMIPGAALYCGRGEGASALLSLSEGDRFVLGSRAEYVRIGEDQNQIPLMMNPHLEANQKRALDFINEVASHYEVDGFLYDDRLRFGGLDSDFSESTRAEFENRIGGKINWPNDIYRVTYSPSLTPGIRPGKFYDDWLTFRSETMRKWVQLASAAFKSHRPNGIFGVYAGSWYGDYQKYGNNYASSELNAGFPFLTHAYKQTGFAGDIDLLITGCYYPFGTVFEAIQRNSAPGRTVEAAGILSNRVVRDSAWTVAGIQLANFWDDPEKVEPALHAAVATTQGVMVFDLSHRIEEFWPVFARAFRTPAQAPYANNSILKQVREQRRLFTTKGFVDPPFPMFEGAPGTGF
ncbi:MAG: alpha amylase family protein [Fimbriimonadaceae bacterium]